jgi:hypothetical protein
VLEPVATESSTPDAEPARPQPVHTGLPDPSKFPLYRPPPPPKAAEEGKIDLNNLPSEADLAVMEKEQITADAIKHIPEYTEDDLRDFYTNVVLSGAAESAQELLPQIAAPEQTTTPGQRRYLLGELTKRLTAPAEEGASVPALQDGVPQHMALTAALMKAAPEPTGLMIPLGLVTKSEWRALFDSFLVRSDPVGAEVLLSTMEKHGVIPTTDDLNEVIGLYATKGQTSEVARLVQDFEAGELPFHGVTDSSGASDHRLPPRHGHQGDDGPRRAGGARHRAAEAG